MASRTSLVRVGAAMLGVSTALMIGVLPAAAGTPASSPHPADTSTATVIGDDGNGATVVMDLSPAEAAIEGKSTVTTQGELNKTQVVSNGVTTTVDAYCIDLTTTLKPGTLMTGGDWDTFIDRNGSKFAENNKQINWILHNSYPSAKYTLHGDLSGLSQAAGLKDTISYADAISATQAAIWHFSDAANLDTTNSQHTPDADLTGLYTYLTGSANTGIAEGTLKITPDSATGTTGKLVGPFTISTDLTDLLTLDVTKLPSGVTVVDANGKQLNSKDLADGTKFYLDVPADATVTTGSVTVSGDTPSGMIFTAAHSQELIAAGQTTVVTLATGTWTQATTGGTTPTSPAAPTTPKTTQPGLAYTGVSATGPIVLGILLIAAGGLFLLVQRRLKRAA